MPADPPVSAADIPALLGGCLLGRRGHRSRTEGLFCAQGAALGSEERTHLSVGLGRASAGAVSGSGVLEGDAAAKSFEPGDEPTGFASGVQAAGEVVGAELVVGAFRWPGERAEIRCVCGVSGFGDVVQWLAAIPQPGLVVGFCPFCGFLPQAERGGQRVDGAVVVVLTTPMVHRHASGQSAPVASTGPNGTIRGRTGRVPRRRKLRLFRNVYRMCQILVIYEVAVISEVIPGLPAGKRSA